MTCFPRLGWSLRWALRVPFRVAPPPRVCFCSGVSAVKTSLRCEPPASAFHGQLAAAPSASRPGEAALWVLCVPLFALYLWDSAVPSERGPGPSPERAGSFQRARSVFYAAWRVIGLAPSPHTLMSRASAPRFVPSSSVLPRYHKLRSPSNPATPAALCGHTQAARGFVPIVP